MWSLEGNKVLLTGKVKCDSKTTHSNILLNVYSIMLHFFVSLLTDRNVIDQLYNVLTCQIMIPATKTRSFHERYKLQNMIQQTKHILETTLTLSL